MQAQPHSILFVCLGNICRSPLAEGVFRAVARERGLAPALSVSSAGTDAWHLGSPPDPRSLRIAEVNGVDLATIRARRVEPQDFLRHDLLLAMDRTNLDELRRRAPPTSQGRLHLFMEYATGSPVDVPDPYFGGPDGFGRIYRMIREASERLADRLAPAIASGAPSGHASSTT